MFVEEKSDSIRHVTEGIEYFFCSNQCLGEFTEPEVELKKLKKQVASSVALTIPIMILSFFQIFSVDVSHYIMLAMATPVQFWIGWRFYRGFWDGIKTRTSNMDSLIAVGTSTAYLYSVIVTILGEHFPVESVYFETSTMIITLILVGRLLESRTKEKASSAVRKLLDLQPRRARIVRNGQEIEIPVEQIRIGEILVARPGESIPTDGTVIEGFSSVDESAITGESVTVDKSPGSKVIGATMNKSGLLKIKAIKVGRDTVLSQIIALVKNAKTGKAKMQKTVDQIAKYFVPAVIIVAISAGLGWYFVGGIGLAYSLLAFVSVIIIACPCALGIATPAALMMGTGKGAENGILFKGGEYLEIAKKVNTIVFDKTGTLTQGRPSVTDVIDLSGMGEQKLLILAAMAESGSEHPLGQAIVRRAREYSTMILSPDSFQAVSGHGLEAICDSNVILIGNRKLMEYNKIFVSDKVDSTLQNLETGGKTAVLVSVNGTLSGIIALADLIKPNAQQALDILRKNAMEIIMLTGDNERTAHAISSKLGIDKVFAEVLPQQKEEVILKLQSKGKVVAMVGDGINDAPALARADLGIAIGSGTDVAKETGGIILIKNDLIDVATAIDLGKKTVSKIKQNLFWAFAYNAGLIPIAAGVLVPFVGVGMFEWLPMLAGGAMALSSVTVVGNSILLGRYKSKFRSKATAEI